MTETNSGKSKEFQDMFMRSAPIFKKFVVHRLDEMEEFKRFTLDAIINEKKSISDRFDRDTQDLSEEQKQEYFEWNSEDYFIVDDVFTQISLRSFIVILFSYIENGMNTLCNAGYSDKARYQKKKGLKEFKIKYTDMHGGGIHRAKLYLEKVIGCNLHTEKKPWSEIQTLRKIRNAIVHKDGNTKDIKKDGNFKQHIKKFIYYLFKCFFNIKKDGDTKDIKKDGNFKQHIKDGRIKINHHDQIIIDPEYLNYILPQVREYFDRIEMK